jgi:hypothetical protein
MAGRGRMLPKPSREQRSAGATRHPGIHGVASPARGAGRAVIGAPLTPGRSTVGPRESAEFPTGVKDVVAVFEGGTQIAMKKAPTIVVIYTGETWMSSVS